MTKEPADWAKIKAYRMMWPSSGLPDGDILTRCGVQHPACRELARMYDLTEKPPADPDLLAARRHYADLNPEDSHHIRRGRLDGHGYITGFLAGIKHGRANP